MFYVNGRRGPAEYRETSASPEGALMYMLDAQEKGFGRITVMDKSQRSYSEAELREMADRSILRGV